MADNLKISGAQNESVLEFGRDHSEKLQQLSRSVLSTLYMLVRSAKMYDPDNAVFDRPLMSLQDNLNLIISREGQFDLVGIKNSFYVNNMLVKVELNAVENIRYLLHEMRAKDVGGLHPRQAGADRGAEELRVDLRQGRGGERRRRRAAREEAAGDQDRPVEQAPGEAGEGEARRRGEGRPKEIRGDRLRAGGVLHHQVPGLGASRHSDGRRARPAHRPGLRRHLLRTEGPLPGHDHHAPGVGVPGLPPGQHLPPLHRLRHRAGADQGPAPGPGLHRPLPRRGDGHPSRRAGRQARGAHPRGTGAGGPGSR